MNNKNSTSAPSSILSPSRQTGVVSAHPKGFGFVVTSTEDEHFIPPALMRELVPGDVIEFKVEQGKKPGATQIASPVVISRADSVWQGTLRYHRGSWVLDPDEACFAPLQVRGLSFAVDNQVVSVRVPGFKGPRRGGPVQASLERLLGERTRPGFDLDYALARYDFEPHFSEAALRQALTLAEPTAGAACPEGRADLRALPYVTIDGESTRDYDDAVYGEKVEGGWRVGVAIADVSHYVTPDSPLDQDAVSHATSVYLPGRTLPMLPEALSNGVCSLVPGQDRYVVALELDLDDQAKVTGSRVTRAVIRSAQRLTYTDVNLWKQGSFQPRPQVEPSLQALWALFEVLAAQRKERGQLEFDSPEPKATVGEDGVTRITWVPRTDAHKLVEELMLLANQCVASRLQATAGALFRHQPCPEVEDWEQVVAWAASRGTVMPSEPSMKALADMTGAVLSEDTLKAELQARNGMRPASYDSEQPSHFSLGFAAYTHFTSPIRRYADLLVHRLLLGDVTYSAESLTDLAAQCSKRSRDGRMAERQVWDKIKKRSMFREVSPDSNLLGHVVSQSRRGLRVVVAEWQASALVSAEDLLDSGFAYDDTLESWVRTSVPLEPGSFLSIRLMRLDEDKARTEIQASLAPCPC